jgi:cell wall-associated NlpC family hydrolase
MATRADIVAAARHYLGQPLRHQGRAGALDCVGLVLAVAEDLALLDVHGEPILRAQYANYSAQPVNGFVQEECARRLVESPTGRLEPGDVLTLRLPTVPCHSAIVTEIAGGLAIVHAYSPAKKVVEHRLDDRWLHRIAGVFSFPDLEELYG